MTKLPTPKALFDTIEYIDEALPACVLQYLQEIVSNSAAGTLQEDLLTKELKFCREFLASYAGSEDTFTAYRREVERLLHWSWLIAQKLLRSLDRNDIRKYLEFLQEPPPAWVTTEQHPRFETNGEGNRCHHLAWRPFVVRVSKAQFHDGKRPLKKNYQLKSKSVQAVFACLSSFFNFLSQEEYVDSNPISLVRQKSRYLQKQQSIKITRKLSRTQWLYAIETIEQLSAEDAQYERHLFMMSAFYLLGLRISELAETPGRIPKMGDFAPDKEDRWWFTTIGKGNKVRDIAVPDTMLVALKRYRKSLDLPPLPARGENTPLLHKLRGREGLGTRQIRNLVQTCFDLAINRLQAAQKQDEAEDLKIATVHWLRHTAISADIEHRPREHVRDDAGHGSAVTTEQYIDADRAERHASAKDKPIKPEVLEKIE